MPFALEIIFTGLLAFVPVDTTGDKRPDMAWVLFLDARVPTPNRDSSKNQNLFDSHFAAIKVPKVSLLDSPRQPDRWVADKQGDFGLFLLDEEDLEIVPKGRPLQFSVLTGLRARDESGNFRQTPCCSDVAPPVCEADTDLSRVCREEKVSAIEQARDFEWTVSFDELVPGATIAPALLDADTSRLRVLVARLKLGHGMLETLRLTGVPEGANPQEVYQQAKRIGFDGGARWSDRAGARQLVLTISGLTDQVTIGSKRFADAAPEFLPLILKPPADCKEPCVVSIAVFNSMLSELYGDAGKHAKSQRHFELLWNLVDPNSRSRPAPFELGPPDDDLICPVVRK